MNLESENSESITTQISRMFTQWATKNKGKWLRVGILGRQIVSFYDVGEKVFTFIQTFCFIACSRWCKKKNFGH